MITELNPSKELLETISQVNRKYGETKDLIMKAYNLALRDGFTPTQAKQFIMAQVRFVSEGTIRKALPDEAKDQSKVRHSSSGNLATNKSQNTETQKQNVVNITTNPEPEEHIGGEPITNDEIQDVAPSRIVDISEKYDAEYAKENPLNKMKSDLTETEVFDWLKKRDNGISIIYWDSFGFRQWRNELTEMENRGIKAFKRLYYEV